MLDYYLKTPCILNIKGLIAFSPSNIDFPWAEKLLEYLKKEDAISAKTAMKLWKVSSRTARSRLKQLQEQGIVVRIGTSESDPSASYIAAKRSS
jgi:predicted HTH transcriptional regulator